MARRGPALLRVGVRRDIALPPPLYYGWVMVGTLAITEMISWGILYYTFPLMLPTMQQTLGWSWASLTAGYSLALFVSGLAAVPVGWWLDRHGPRLLMTVGSLAAALLVLAWSQVEQAASFYLIWGGIGLAMAAVLYEPAFAVVATWFVQRRSRALTVLTLGGGLASPLFSPLAAWLLAQYDWRRALMWLALLLALGTLPAHALLLRRRPEDLGLLPDGAAIPLTGHPAEKSVEASTPVTVVLRSGAFWAVALAFSLSVMAAVAMTVVLVPLMAERGYSLTVAASIAALVGGSALPGRLLFAPLSSRVAPRPLAMTLFGLQGVALLVLLWIPSTLGIVSFAILFGAAAGAATPARAGLIATWYGPATYGRISGVMALVMTSARALAPVGAGFFYGRWQQTTPVLGMVIGIALSAILAMALARPDQRE